MFRKGSSLFAILFPKQIRVKLKRIQPVAYYRETQTQKKSQTQKRYNLNQLLKQYPGYFLQDVNTSRTCTILSNTFRGSHWNLSTDLCILSNI